MQLLGSSETISSPGIAIAGNAYLGNLIHANTATRNYTFPDTTGTVLLNNNVLGYALPTLTTGYLNWTGSSWAFSSGGGGMSNPMTTLGDIIYENATPAPARLAGNINNAAYILSQTGTGTISAAPSWLGTTGTGLVALQTSPIFTTPNINAATGTSLTLTNASSVAFLTTTRSDLSNSVTLTQSATNIITCSGALAATQFTGSGVGLSLGTVTDTYTIQSLGTLTTTGSVTISSGRYIKMTLGGNIIFNIPNGSSSTATEKIIFEITQDSTGSRTIYWTAQRGFVANATPVLSTTPGAVDILEFTWNGMYWMNTDSVNDITQFSNITIGVRPTGYNTVGTNWGSANVANIWDTGTTASVDTTTYGEINCIYATHPTTAYFTGFSGAIKSGVVYVRCYTVNGSGSSTMTTTLSYSINGGSSYTAFGTITNPFGTTATTTYSSSTLTSVNPTNLIVSININDSSTLDNDYVYIYDIVFI